MELCEVNYDVDGDEMWFMILQMMFLLIFFFLMEQDLCLGFVSRNGTKKFFIFLPAIQRKIVIEFLIISCPSIVLKGLIGDSEVCYLSSALKVNSSLTGLNLGFI